MYSGVPLGSELWPLHHLNQHVRLHVDVDVQLWRLCLGINGNAEREGADDKSKAFDVTHIRIVELTRGGIPALHKGYKASNLCGCPQSSARATAFRSDVDGVCQLNGGWLLGTGKWPRLVRCSLLASCRGLVLRGERKTAEKQP